MTKRVAKLVRMDIVGDPRLVGAPKRRRTLLLTHRSRRGDTSKFQPRRPESVEAREARPQERLSNTYVEFLAFMIETNNAFYSADGGDQLLLTMSY